jgi:hypothetical protein
MIMWKLLLLCASYFPHRPLQSLLAKFFEA